MPRRPRSGKPDPPALMILARTLRRTFLLRGPLPDDGFPFLQADPHLPAPAERTEVVDIEPRGDGLVAMTCSWYRHRDRPSIGSARALARFLDEAIFRLAVSDEGAAPTVNGSVLRIDGIRCLLVSEFEDDPCDLAVALILHGAAFEGIYRIFLHPDGVVAHPVKPRLKHNRLIAAGLSPSHLEWPTLPLNRDTALCAIDPRMAGVDWSVEEGPIEIVLFVERNEGGRPAITRIGGETAFARLLRNIRSTQRLDLRAFIGLRTIIHNAQPFRVSMGDAVSAAALIMEQRTYLHR